MTICAAVKARDGLVLATDSMTQISVQAEGEAPDGTSRRIEMVAQTYSHATKLFRVGDLPIGVMLWGLGNIGEKSVPGLMRELPDIKHGEIEEIATTIYQYFQKAYREEFNETSKQSRHVLGMYIAGYGKDKPFAEEWNFVLPGDKKPRKVRKDSETGVSWRGETLYFSRLHNGIDPRILPALKKSGIDPKLIENQINPILSAFKLPIEFNGMPIQDAISMAEYIISTTIMASTFEMGPPSCGGSIQCAVIHPSRRACPDDRFEWIAKPKLSLRKGTKDDC